MRNYISVGNSFDKKKFDEICGLLRRGMRIEPVVSCIGHTLNNMIQNEYKIKLEEEFGAELETTYHEGVCSYGYSYKLKEKVDNYKQKIEKIVQLIDEIIIQELSEYSTRDLEDVVLGLVDYHAFTSADSIQGLIYELEKLKDLY